MWGIFQGCRLFGISIYIFDERAKNALTHEIASFLLFNRNGYSLGTQEKACPSSILCLLS